MDGLEKARLCSVIGVCALNKLQKEEWEDKTEVREDWNQFPGHPFEKDKSNQEKLVLSFFDLSLTSVVFFQVISYLFLPMFNIECCVV